MDGQRQDRYAATTINRRLAAISGLFTFAGLRSAGAKNPVPKGRPGGRGEGPGCWRTRHGDASLVRRCGCVSPRPPSLRTWRDRAIAGLVLWSGLRSRGARPGQDVDIGGRVGHRHRQGNKQRRVRWRRRASVIDVYLLAERPADCDRLFLVAGPHRGRG